MPSNMLCRFRKWGLIGLVLCLVGAAAIWLLVPRAEQAGEPSYQGKPLSVWLAGYRLGQSHPEIDQAVRAIGSNAVPTLLRMLRAKDRPVLDKLANFARKQSLIKIQYTPAETLRFRAIAGLGALGAEAKGAVPELVKAYTNQPPNGPLFGPGAALAEIGPAADEATEILLLNAQDTNSAKREIAVSILARLGTQPEVVVPALIRALRDPHPAVQYQAFRGLGNYGREAKAAVPVLCEIMTNAARINARNDAAIALGQVAGPETIVPVLIQWAHSTNADVRLMAVDLLDRFGKEPGLCVATLTELLSYPDLRVRLIATNSLASIDPNFSTKTRR